MDEDQKTKIITTVVKQVFRYHMDISSVMPLHLSLRDPATISVLSLIAIWRDLEEIFVLSIDVWAVDTVAELVDVIRQQWGGDRLDGVNIYLQWVPLEERSLPFWEEENLDWKPWQSPRL